MRELEVRRHSKRQRPGQHLTQWGVARARRVGAGIGPFDLVVTSPLARCVETAIAMGFAVSDVDARLAGPDGAGETFPEMDAFDGGAGRAGLARLIARGGPVASFALEQAALWREIALRLPEGGRGLIVAHGAAFLDGVALTLRPDDPALATGALASYCEGVRVRYGPADTTVSTLAVHDS
ncbi:MAG TPA: phosphoglycerate mutase family protein [Candidatus Limnocylindria bacterium]|nr:phosphoglycerate mutase family protein [Candidatus Limnocylindria bacterium]